MLKNDYINRLEYMKLYHFINGLCLFCIKKVICFYGKVSLIKFYVKSISRLDKTDWKQEEDSWWLDQSKRSVMSR